MQPVFCLVPDDRILSFEDRIRDFFTAVGGQVVVLLPSVGGVKEVNDYFQLFDYDINLLTAALAKSK